MTEENIEKKKFQFDIFKLYNTVPGGIIIVPLFTFAIINTLFPDLLTTLGGMTGGLFKTGTLAFTGICMFASGATLNVKQLGTIFRRFGPLLIVKLGVGMLLGFVFVKAFGLGGALGINAIAFVTVACSANPGIFLGICSSNGDKEDLGGFPFIAIASMQAWPILIVGLGSGGVDWFAFLSVLIPFFLGLFFGQFDKTVGKLMNGVVPIVTPFLGACFGSAIDLKAALSAGIPGVILGVVMFILFALILIPVDRKIGKRPGYAACGWCTVAGSSLAVPMLMTGEMYQPYAAAALSQIAIALLIMAILCPILTKIVVKKWGDGKVVEPVEAPDEEAQIDAPAETSAEAPAEAQIEAPAKDKEEA